MDALTGPVELDDGCRQRRSPGGGGVPIGLALSTMAALACALLRVRN